MTGVVTLVKAERVLTGHDGMVIKDGGVLVRDGRIAAVGRSVDLTVDADEQIDAGAVIMPGMIDAHSHLRGIPLSAQGIMPRPLESWLCSLAAATALPAEDDVLVAAADLLRTGVTSVQAFIHSFQDAPGLAELWKQTETAIERSGIRALLCAGFADFAELAPEPSTGVWASTPAIDHGTTPARFGELVANVIGERDDPARRVRWGLGPIAPQWVTDEALAVIAARAAGRRLHAHLDESRLQRAWVRGQAAPVARLSGAGCLDARLSAAHGVDLLDEEIDEIAAGGATLVHCPTSNRALAVGTARVARWHRSGIQPALGMDSAGESADMFGLMRAAVEDSEAIGDPISSAMALAMATTGGARALGVPRLGRVAPGAPADFVGIELGDSGEDAGALAEFIVRTGTPQAVRNVWVDGMRVLADGSTVVDATAERARLARAIDADADRRSARQRELAPLLERLDRELEEVAA